MKKFAFAMIIALAVIATSQEVHAEIMWASNIVEYVPGDFTRLSEYLETSEAIENARRSVIGSPSSKFWTWELGEGFSLIVEFEELFLNSTDQWGRAYDVIIEETGSGTRYDDPIKVYVGESLAHFDFVGQSYGGARFSMPEDLQGEYKYVMVLPNTDIRASSNPTIEGIGIYHPIPEPATLTLLAMGAGLFIRKRNHPK